MTTDDEARALEHLVARVREAEKRADLADQQKTELDSLRARVRADADEIRTLRSAAATAHAAEKKLQTANTRIERLLERIGNVERRRDDALAVEADALARCTALERELAQVADERDRLAEDLRRFRALRWNRLGVKLRVPVNAIRSMVGR